MCDIPLRIWPDLATEGNKIRIYEYINLKLSRTVMHRGTETITYSITPIVFVHIIY